MPELENFADLPIVNTEKLENIISSFKYPILLGFGGLVMLIVALILLIKQNSTGNDVIFTTQATASAEKKILVDVAGAVIEPGIYQFSEGERISDGLIKAGGLAQQADREWIAKNLNRAAKLIDGGKIYIPSQNEITEGKSSPSTGGLNPKSEIANNTLGVTTGKININSASEKELDTLPGIGSVTAQKIIKGRPYQSIEELKSKKIIGNSLYEKLKDLLIVN